MTEEQNNLVERCLKYCKLNGLHLNEIDQVEKVSCDIRRARMALKLSI